jgi:hypothetical protein
LFLQDRIDHRFLDQTTRQTRQCFVLAHSRSTDQLTAVIDRGADHKIGIFDHG